MKADPRLVWLVWTLAGAVVVLAITRADADERQIRRDCTADALRYCAKSIPKGRAAIIACMIENRSNLRPNCQRHIYE